MHWGVSGPGRGATHPISLLQAPPLCFPPPFPSSFCSSDKPTGPQLSLRFLSPSVLEPVLRRHGGELRPVLPAGAGQLPREEPSR